MRKMAIGNFPDYKNQLHTQRCKSKTRTLICDKKKNADDALDYLFLIHIQVVYKYIKGKTNT